MCSALCWCGFGYGSELVFCGLIFFFNWSKEICWCSLEFISSHIYQFHWNPCPWNFYFILWPLKLASYIYHLLNSQQALEFAPFDIYQFRCYINPIWMLNFSKKKKKLHYAYADSYLCLHRYSADLGFEATPIFCDHGRNRISHKR